MCPLRYFFPNASGMNQPADSSDFQNKVPDLASLDRHRRHYRNRSRHKAIIETRSFVRGHFGFGGGSAFLRFSSGSPETPSAEAKFYLGREGKSFLTHGSCRRGTTAAIMKQHIEHQRHKRATGRGEHLNDCAYFLAFVSVCCM